MENPGASGPPSLEAYADVKDFIAAHEAYWDSQQPNERELLQRASRLADASLRAVRMQLRRLGGEEPEDAEWLLRKVTDFRFLLAALWRLRATAVLVGFEPLVKEAIEEFDAALPDLAPMRHVDQHFEDYAADSPGKARRQAFPDGRIVGRRALEVLTFSGSEVHWLRRSLPLDRALRVSEDLCLAIDRARVAKAV